LDVKTGSGAFMKTVEESRTLAEMMVEIGRRAGKKMRALITDMDRPLGCAIGNSLEVIEAIETLQGKGPADLTEVCLALATHMLTISGHGDEATCRAYILRVIENGEALATLARMVGAQGGDPAWIYDTAKFPQAAYTYTVAAPCDGYIIRADAEGYGMASLLLGAGRNTKEDAIDYAAGIHLLKKTGDRVRVGEAIATLYAGDERLFAAAESRLLAATEIGAEPPAARPLILDVIA
jgi:pyrimidine-nucleoside phosphorylase